MEIENGRYAILYGSEGQRPAAKLYTFSPDGEAIEAFDQSSRSYRIFPDGEIGYEENGRYWLRPVFERDAPFSPQPAAFDPWLQISNNLFVTMDSDGIVIYDRASGALIERLQVPGYENGYQSYPILSPDEQWLAIFVHESSYSLGKALFVVPAVQE